MKLTDEELTRLAVEKVMGWTPYASHGIVPGWRIPEGPWIEARDWNPLTDWRAAGEIVDKMRADGWCCRAANNACAKDQNGAEFHQGFLGLGRNIFHSDYDDVEPELHRWCVASSIPRAITIAALLAVKAITEDQV